MYSKTPRNWKDRYMRVILLKAGYKESEILYGPAPQLPDGYKWWTYYKDPHSDFEMKCLIRDKK